MNICTRCQKEYNYKRATGCTKQLCSSCSINQHRHCRKQKCIDHKGGACSSCGYNKCNRALTFHHVDLLTKKFGISGAHTRSWEVTKKELDKCILLCQNCHMELHDQEGL